MENKNEGNENKIILETLILLWMKWTDMVEIRQKDLINAVPIMPSFWIMGLRYFGEGKTRIFLSSTAMIGLFARIQDRRSLY